LRLLLDEHFNYAIAEELRRRGIDAVAIQQERPELEGQEDEVLLRAAAAERRVVVTKRTHAGIGLIVRAVTDFVEGTRDDDLLDSCLYLPRPR
jgi:hypothetical protein